MKIYIDSKEEGTTAKTGNVLNVNNDDATNGSVAVGMASGVNNSEWTSYTGFSGKIDEVISQTKGLSLGDIKKWYGWCTGRLM